MVNIKNSSLCGLRGLLNWLRRLCGESYDQVPHFPPPNNHVEESEEEIDLESLLSSPMTPRRNSTDWPPQPPELESLMADMKEKLPREIITLIMVHVLSEYSYTMHLFAEHFSPTWWGWQNPQLARARLFLDYMRGEVYTRASESAPARYEITNGPIYTMGHVPDEDHHISLSNSSVAANLKRFSPECFADAVNEARREQTSVFSLPRSIEREFPRGDIVTSDDGIFRYFFETSYLLVSPVLFLLPFCGLVDERFSHLNHRASVRGLFNEEEGRPSPKYTRIRHLMLGSTRYYEDEWDFLFCVDGPLSEHIVEELKESLEIEQTAWLYLDWSKLGRLKSLYLNLDFIEQRERQNIEDLVRKAALNMSASLRLDLLVIYGLKSGMGYVKSPFELSVEQIENEPQLKVGDKEFPNWIRAFKGAVRPGGQLILLDEKILSGRPRPESIPENMTMFQPPAPSRGQTFYFAMPWE